MAAVMILYLEAGCTTFKWLLLIVLTTMQNIPEIMSQRVSICYIPSLHWKSSQLVMSHDWVM